MANTIYNSVLDICACGKIWHRRRIHEARDANSEGSRPTVQTCQTGVFHHNGIEVCRVLSRSRDCEGFARADRVDLNETGRNVLGDAELTRSHTFGLLYTCDHEEIIGRIGPLTMSEQEILKLWPADQDVSGSIQNKIIDYVDGVCMGCRLANSDTAEGSVTQQMSQDEMLARVNSEEFLKLLTWDLERRALPEPSEQRFNDPEYVQLEHGEGIRESVRADQAGDADQRATREYREEREREIRSMPPIAVNRLTPVLSDDSDSSDSSLTDWLREYRQEYLDWERGPQGRPSPGAITKNLFEGLPPFPALSRLRTREGLHNIESDRVEPPQTEMNVDDGNSAHQEQRAASPVTEPRTFRTWQMR